MRPFRFAACSLLIGLAGVGFADHNARPARVYDLQNVAWHLSFDETLGTIKGDVTNTVVPLKSGTKEIYFDSSKLAIRSVTVNGTLAKFKTDEVKEMLFVTLPKVSGPSDKLDVRIIYTGRPEAGIYMIPAKRAFPAHTSVVYTQGEMIDTHYWLPTYDNPDDKTTWDSYVKVPNDYRVITNGRMIDSKPAGGNMKVVHYRMEQPMATYLISLITGKYDRGDDGHFGKTPVYWNVPEGLDDMGKMAFGGTDKMIALYSKQTGFDYPYAKFEQSAVPDYMFGGMENITAVTQTIDALYPPDAAPVVSEEGLALHELAHQWFGDTITCSSWAHAWLNEGFATFLPNFYVRYAHGEDAYDLARYGNLQGGLRSGVPIVWTGYKEPIDAFFEDNVYAGGCARMFWLMHTVGEDKFWAGIKVFLNTYKYTPVDTPTFFKSMSKSTGTDLTTFMNEWFYRIGTPHITVKRSGNDLLIDQKTPIFTLPLDVWVLNGTTWEKKHVDANTAETKLPLGDLAGKPVLVDPEVFLPAYISYDYDISPDDYMAMYRNAPNVAAKARMQGAMLQKLSADQVLELAKEEKNVNLLSNMFEYVKDENWLIQEMDSSDPKIVNALVGVPNDYKMSSRFEAKVREIAMNHPNLAVRQSAMGSLLRLTNDDDLAAKAWATPSYNEEFRNDALFYYDRTNKDKAREMCLDQLAHPLDEKVRQTCIDMLGELKDKPGETRVYDALIKVVQERSFGALNNAIGALAQYGNKDALKYLRPLTTNSMVFTRRSAQGAVKSLGG